MTMSSSINRRQLGKGLLAGAALRTIGASTEAQTSSAGARQVDSRWLPVAPGIWKARIGSPEPITPVPSRLVVPRLDALRTLHPVTAPPLAAPTGKGQRRGTLVALTLAPHEELYGFGLQFFSVAHRSEEHTSELQSPMYLV